MISSFDHSRRWRAFWFENEERDVGKLNYSHGAPVIVLRFDSNAWPTFRLILTCPLLRFENRARLKRLGSKIEAKCHK